MNESPVVYVVQEPPKVRGGEGEWPYKYDINKASKFGEVRIVLSWNEVKNLGTFRLIGLLKSRLAEYTEGDYLLTIGKPTVMIVAALIAVRKAERIQLLLHDRATDDYLLETLHCDDFRTGEEDVRS